MSNEPLYSLKNTKLKMSRSLNYFTNPLMLNRAIDCKLEPHCCKYQVTQFSRQNEEILVQFSFIP